MKPRFRARLPDVEGLMEGSIMRSEMFLRLLLILTAILVLVGYWQALPDRTAYIPEPDIRISEAPEPSPNR